mmetsp:Transcript_5629/g.9891  ORF Transcript_5629/g.9891 Transcript_5629/m.9891 type:complete len:111 (-) Transcript_5629:567-899(-)
MIKSDSVRGSSSLNASEIAVLMATNAITGADRSKSRITPVNVDIVLKQTVFELGAHSLVTLSDISDHAGMFKEVFPENTKGPMDSGDNTAGKRLSRLMNENISSTTIISG